MTDLKYFYVFTWSTCHQRKAVSSWWHSDYRPADQEPTPLSSRFQCFIRIMPCIID